MALTINQWNDEAFQSAVRKRRMRTKPAFLIVEDQQFSRILLENMLSKDFEAASVVSGEEAIKKYNMFAPDIVFLDIELPEISGHKVLEIFNKFDDNSFVVMVTGNSYKEDVVKSYSLGAKGFVAKPYSKDKIYEAISRYKKLK